MNVREGAALIGSEEQLFVRAMKQYGHIWAQGSAIDCLNRYRRSGIVPEAVKMYLKYIERKYKEQPPLFI